MSKAIITDLKLIQEEIRLVLMTKSNKDRINNRALMPSWPHRDRYQYLFDSIEKIAPYDCSFSEKIKIILYHDNKDPRFCYNCCSSNTHRTKMGDYLCDECAQIRKIQKTVQTNLTNYGVPYQIASDSTRSKSKKTLKERYGVEHNMHVPSFSIKQSATKKQKKYSKEQLFLIENPDLLYREYVENKIPVYELARKYGFGHRFVLLLFHKHGFEIKTSRGYSFEQETITNEIENLLGLNVERNARSVIPPKELDIWIPTLNVGIEYHGVYWHKGLSDTRCEEKYFLAKNNSIVLLQFFDFEFDEKKDICLSIIRSKLKKNENKIHARKCVIKEIDSKTYANFCGKYHIQGHVNASIRIGLFFEDTLVSIMAFGKSRFSKAYEYELIRYACISNTTVSGGASKLLKYFERTYNPKSICSFSDCRLSDGNLYLKLGFTFKHHSNSNYFYINDLGELVKRYAAQKHKLRNFLGDSFNENLSEKENMENNGYVIVNDAGNDLFIKEYNA